MENQNPYRAPPPLVEEVELTSDSFDETDLGLEFVSDWSTEGIKLRRRNSMHVPADFAVAILSVLWIGLLLLSPVSQRATGLACLLTPIWLCAGGLWLTNLGFRNASSFAKACRGLCGPVTGRVERGYVSIQGPAICFATHVDHCSQSNWATDGGAVFRPPMITELLPVLETDIQRTWKCRNELQQNATENRLLGRLPESLDSDRSEPVIATGELRGPDLRGQSIWRRWLTIGTTMTILGLFGLSVVVYKWHNLPPWIVDPPSHYIPGTEDRQAISTLVVILLVASLSLGYGVYCLSRMRASYGWYAVAISPTRVALSSKLIALGYYGEALRHFTWTRRGVIVRSAAGKFIFLLPARWFDLADQQKLSVWLGDSGKPSADADFYVGPRL